MSVIINGMGIEVEHRLTRPGRSNSEYSSWTVKINIPDSSSTSTSNLQQLLHELSWHAQARVLANMVAENLMDQEEFNQRMAAFHSELPEWLKKGPP